MSTTESPSNFDHLEQMPIRELLYNINQEDHKVPQVIKELIPDIEALVEEIVPRMLAHTDTCPHAAIRHKELPVFCLQFHPEVTHTDEGGTMLKMRKQSARKMVWMVSLPSNLNLKIHDKTDKKNHFDCL